MNRAIILSLTAFSAVLVSGCLVNHSHHQVIRKSEPLQHVTFQSEETRNAFEQCVQDAIDNDSNYAHSSFGVPFLLGLQRTQKTAENAVRNDTIAKFDVNGDLYISDYEISLR